MEEQQFNKDVVCITQPERVRNYKIFDKNHQISDKIQMFSIEDFDSVRHYNGLEKLRPSDGMVLIKHPFKPNTYCELSENIDFTISKDKMHYIGQICSKLGAKSIKCSYKNMETQKRVRNGKIGAEVKSINAKVSVSSEQQQSIEQEFKLEIPCSGNLTEETYNEAVELAEKYNLQNDSAIETLLNLQKPHTRLSTPYKLSVVCTQEASNLLDIAFTLSGLKFFNVFDAQYKQYVEYKRKLELNIHVDF